ncbi:nuclear transport factor 2 family protein [Salegentibacter sp. JZCK2]|uniref:nuclear transport factor 2 family protein n=1 Tax=Salegentibacter tibetensis TaxID=2873600 RepID=UPI001CCEB43D|nr:nuclear transport factor 2 family protein [Salegentibacter tibetensis]MBZ9731150.1 nuclear transport factor 2 family protein [Salegentibacter tibetensis]
MRHSILLVFILSIIALPVKSQTSGDTSEEVRMAIQQNFQQMVAAMAAGNARELSMYFTEDALLKFPGEEPVKGRKAIEEIHQQIIDQGFGIRPNTQEVQVAGNLAFEIGTYEMLDKQGEKIDQGHYATVWEKEDDQWRISRDIISRTKETPSEIVVTAKPGIARDHLYVELWNPKQAWLDLSTEERQSFFSKVGGEIEKLTGAGVEVLGFAVNDKETPNRSDHKYIAVWKMPSKDHVEMLENSVSQAGWYDYFEQVNARGELISPPAVLEDMIKLK